MPTRVRPEGLVEDRSRQPLRFLGLPPRLWRVVQEYCQQSSLHGLKYISNTDMPYIERYLWLGIFVASVVYAVHLIYEAWMFWREKPFLITFDSHMTPIWSVPFPTVTVCTHFAIKRSIVNLATTTNRTVLYYASLTCPMKEKLQARAPEVDYIGNEFFDFLKEVSPKCPEVLKRCLLMNKEVNCCDIFDPIVTEYGLCYIYNNLPLDRVLTNNTYIPFASKPYPPHTRFWNPDDGYPHPDLRGANDSFTYPRWEQLAGEDFGLKVELFQNISEWQQLCSGAFSGFKVILTSPADLPIHSKVDLRLSISRETNLMLTPVALKSRPEMASLKPSVRSCFFKGEKPLRFFSLYTNNNCNLECISQQFIRECGCVPFYFPREPHTRICSRKKHMFCLQKARTKLINEAIDVAVDGQTYAHPCNCFKGCQEITYLAEDFYTDFVHGGRDPPWADKPLGGDQVTRVSVYFKNNQFLHKHRSIRYTTIKFAGTCGGLLSLLLGFSVISIIEVLYAFVLRPLSRSLHDCCHSQSKVILVEPARQQHQAFSVTGLYAHTRSPPA